MKLSTDFTIICNADKFRRKSIGTSSQTLNESVFQGPMLNVTFNIAVHFLPGLSRTNWSKKAITLYKLWSVPSLFTWVKYSSIFLQLGLIIIENRIVIMVLPNYSRNRNTAKMRVFLSLSQAEYSPHTQPWTCHWPRLALVRLASYLAMTHPYSILSFLVFAVSFPSHCRVPCQHLI